MTKSLADFYPAQTQTHPLDLYSVLCRKLHANMHNHSTSPTPSPLPSSPLTGFSTIDAGMAAARAKYTHQPIHVASIRANAVSKLTSPWPPTPADLACTERSDGAIVRSSLLTAGAQAQLAAPVSAFLPAGLTEQEVAEQADAESWEEGFARAEAVVEGMLEGSQRVSVEVVGLVGEVEAMGLLGSDGLEGFGDWGRELKKCRSGEGMGRGELGEVSTRLDAVLGDLTAVKERRLSVRGGEAPVSSLVALYENNGNAPTDTMMRPMERTRTQTSRRNSPRGTHAGEPVDGVPPGMFMAFPFGFM